MNPLNPQARSALVIQDEREDQKRFEEEVQGIIDLHDFVRAHPDGPAKEIARFMPPVNAKVVSVAIQRIALRDKGMKK